MLFIIFFLATLWAPLVASGSIVGFNYGATWANHAAKTKEEFLKEFKAAKSLPNVPQDLVTSARLFTTVQPGGTEPISAIEAAMETNTTLFLGFWAPSLDIELVAFNKALVKYGDDFINLIVGISVGNEDIFRASQLCKSFCDGGLSAETITAYVLRVKENIKNSKYAEKLKHIKIGHVDTGVNWPQVPSALFDAVDFVGVTGYPYYNKDPIDSARESLFGTISRVKEKAQGKEIWLAETGWPFTGQQMGAAVSGASNMERYWKEVGCALFKDYNTFWFQFVHDAHDGLDWGVVDQDSFKSRVDLSCPAVDLPSPSVEPSTPFASSDPPQPSSSDVSTRPIETSASSTAPEPVKSTMTSTASEPVKSSVPSAVPEPSKTTTTSVVPEPVKSSMSSVLLSSATRESPISNAPSTVSKPVNTSGRPEMMSTFTWPSPAAKSTETSGPGKDIASPSTEPVQTTSNSVTSTSAPVSVSSRPVITKVTTIYTTVCVTQSRAMASGPGSDSSEFDSAKSGPRTSTVVVTVTVTQAATLTLSSKP